MPDNEFLPFATDVGANVMAQVDYAALSARDTGFQAGTAISEQLNKVWRQASSMSAMLGKFIVDVGGVDALDDGDIDVLTANFIAALSGASVTASIPYGVDSGALNTMVVTPTPAVASLTAGLLIVVKANNTNTSSVTVNVAGLGAVPIVNTDGSAVQAGQIVDNGLVIMAYDGAAFQMLSMPPLTFFLSSGGSGSATDFYGPDTGAANAYIVSTTPTFVSLVAGTVFRTRIANDNTGDSTVNVNGSGAVQILSAAGIALEGGELQGGGFYSFVFDQSVSKWRLLSSSLGPLAGEDPTEDQHFTTKIYALAQIAAAITTNNNTQKAISNVRSVMREWPLVPPVAGTYRFVLRARVAGTIDSLAWNCGTASASFVANVRINGASVTGLSAVTVNNTTTQVTLANSGTPVPFAANAEIDVVLTAVSTSPVPIGAALQINYTLTG